ncbi:hypothetical protein ACQP3L_38760, partial [Escherichia coli]
GKNNRYGFEINIKGAKRQSVVSGKKSALGSHPLLVPRCYSQQCRYVITLPKDTTCLGFFT